MERQATSKFTPRERTILEYALYNHEYISLALVNYTKVHFGWTTLQFSCIAYLKRFGKLSMSALARYLSVSKQQATQLVASLVKHGLASRIQSELNRRVIYVIPTELAVSELLESEHAFVDSVTKYLDQMSNGDTKNVMDAMEVLISFAIALGEHELEHGDPLIAAIPQTDPV